MRQKTPPLSPLQTGPVCPSSAISAAASCDEPASPASKLSRKGYLAQDSGQQGLTTFLKPRPVLASICSPLEAPLGFPDDHLAYPVAKMAEVDFDMGPKITDGRSGETFKTWIFVCTLAGSRQQWGPDG